MPKPTQIPTVGAPLNPEALREYERRKLALTEAVWRCADQDECDTLYEERIVEQEREERALDEFVYSLLARLASQEEALRTAVNALHDVREHHVALNDRVGRPAHLSRTIGIVDTALVQLPPGTRARTLTKEGS